MYLKGIALFVAIYGRGALAALPDSCEEGDVTCNTGCTPLNTEFEPPGVGQVWYSYCCTESETSTADPPVTETKKYCYSYSLVGWPNNQYSGTKPSCSSTSTALAWSLHGQCSTTTGADPYPTPTPTGDGCPGQWDSSTNYEVDDTVEDNDVVYKCSGAAAYCNTYGPDLRGVGSAYWIPIGSCTGTGTPTESPTFATASTQAGCPEEFDSSTTYEANDSVAITRDDGTSILYRCKAFPESQWCNDDAYSPLNTEKLCNGGPCWPRAWIKQGSCTGTFTPTATPTFAQAGGCPEAYDESADYEAGDKMSITPAGEEYGKIYQCKSWPNSGYCGQEAYSPANTEKGCNGEVCWPAAWTYVGGCTGTLTPTATPTFDGDLDGCPEAYDESAEYEAGDKVSVTPAGETIGKIYQCKSWPNSGNCVKEAYSPANTEKGCNGEVCWPDAWTYVGGCTGTLTPTATPTFAQAGGCPEAYDESAEYEAGDKVSVTPAGEEYGKIYQCKSWPNSGFCNREDYSPANTEKGCNGKVCWPNAWTYVGGCTGTIVPTSAPMFTSLAQWEKEGCPEEYVPNNSNYKPGDYVSVSKNDGNTYGVVWMCKNAMTAPWCQNEGYAPGTSYGGQAWEKVGYCEGTMSPTAAPNGFTGVCQFKYNLETTDDGAYVVLQADSWVKGGSTVSTGGTALDLYQSGQLVRYGNDARKCKSWPYSGYCEGFSPFVQDSPDYNPLLSSQGWEKATCGAVGTNGVNDKFNPSTKGPVFASNGNMLVNKDGECQTGVATSDGNDSDATNPGDYFKPSPAVKGCQKCAADHGLDSITAPKVCTACQDGAESKIVDGKSVCVCKNGASNPWADPVTGHCKSCPSGKKYLGNVDNSAGDGTCAPCPTGLKYTTKINGSDTYNLCCKDAGCSDNGHNNILSECFDGTSAKTFCDDAGINVSHAPTDVPSLQPSLAPTSTPTSSPTSKPTSPA